MFRYFLFALVSLQASTVFAMGKPMTQEKIAELNKTQYQCELVTASEALNGVTPISYTPKAPLLLTTTQWGTSDAYPGKCISVPLSDDGKTQMSYGCIQLTDKTVSSFDDSGFKAQEDGGFGTFWIDLTNGEGHYSVSATYGWHHEHDEVDVTLKNCKKL